MLRSLYSGVSGLKSHQVRMDVIGNNIANVNTLGFKKSRVTFQDTLSQMLKGANRSEGDQGGVNPSQVGLGVTVGSVETLHTQGNLQPTGKTTDLAIDGEGFFVLKDPGGGSVYSRVGAFDFDAMGFLVNAQGYKVQGYMADPAAGTVGSTLEDLTITNYLQSAATDTILFANNLNADAADGTSYTVSKSVYDSVGVEHVVDISITKNSTAYASTNAWDYQVSLSADDPLIQDYLTANPAATLTDAQNAVFGGAPADRSGVIIFDANGQVDETETSTQNGTTPPDLFNTFTFDPTDPEADPVIITPDFSQLTQYGSKTTIIAQSQTGNPAGTIKDLTIQTDGTIIGDFEGGYRRILGKAAIASFTNPTGLVTAGSGLYRPSGNSGDGVAGSAQTLGRGSIISNTLEMSNVDLAEEFTEMITTQRGFQANSRTITTSDEMLQELVNLKR